MNKKYQIIKKGGKFLRDNYSPNPTESLCSKGIVGKVLSDIINILILKPIHLLTYFIVGLFYKRDKHSPWIGSLLYTAITFPLKWIITLIKL